MRHEKSDEVTVSIELSRRGSWESVACRRAKPFRCRRRRCEIRICDAQEAAAIEQIASAPMPQHVDRVLWACVADICAGCLSGMQNQLSSSLNLRADSRRRRNCPKHAACILDKN